MKPNWFVGLPVKAGLWFEKAISALPEGLRAFHESDLHITIAFLGQYHSSYERDVLEYMKKVKAAPFEVSLSRLVALPDERRFSALSYTLDQGRVPAAGLIGSHREALSRAACVPADTRPALPHLTIVRPGFRKSLHEKKRILEQVKDLTVPDVRIVLDSVALYTWAEDRKERKFRIIEEVDW